MPLFYSPVTTGVVCRVEYAKDVFFAFVLTSRDIKVCEGVSLLALFTV
jgi:hypothetical protein